WKVTRINRIGKEGFLAVSPELTDIRVGLEYRVDEPAVLARNFSQIDIAYDISQVVEFDRSSHGVDVNRPKRAHQRRLVLDIAIDRLDGSFQHRAVDVGACRVKSRIVLELLAKRGGKYLVRLVVQFGRVPAGRHDTKRFIAHVAQHRFV